MKENQSKHKHAEIYYDVCNHSWTDSCRKVYEQVRKLTDVNQLWFQIKNPIIGKLIENIKEQCDD